MRYAFCDLNRPIEDPATLGQSRFAGLKSAWVGSIPADILGGGRQFIMNRRLGTDPESLFIKTEFFPEASARGHIVEGPCLHSMPD